MTDISIRTEGKAGRITLTRPKALNAMTYDMCLAIRDALEAWAVDDSVSLVIVDAEGDKAFCAGGDITSLYETGKTGDYEYGRRFWRDEYRTNARIAEFPKPYIAFMQGFTMGGGVGIGCHGSHRIVGESSQIAMPECGIGLVPDVGGSMLLARAPGRVGEYLGTTAERMGPDDAIFAGFADTFVPQEQWPGLIAALCDGADPAAIAAHAGTAPDGSLRHLLTRIDAHFGGETLRDILNSLKVEDSDFADATLAKLARNSPLSMACTVEMVHRNRASGTDIRRALELEYRFTHRSMEQGDLLEGIRAAVIDKDRAPRWQHDIDAPPALAATQMLMPLGADALTFEEEG
ncbi:3-hydroxyisobutyryl-CoA hydrolase [Roseovarius salis]|uniref:enoyl-CoA hydratase/isomerase family protein n=1 Tax=Roseovarius salis TaxID=3376063 RepID=UPI0037CA1DE3